MYSLRLLSAQGARCVLAIFLVAVLILTGCDQSIQSPDAQESNRLLQEEGPTVRKTAQGRLIPDEIIQYGQPGSPIRRAVEEQNKHTAALMKRPDVISVGSSLTESGDPLIVITVKDNLEKNRSRLPARLGKIPTEIKQGEIPVVSVNLTGDAPSPITTGYSIGHPNSGAGTYGACVEREGQTTSLTQDEFVLSNNHVMANLNNADLGDPILQPGPFDGGTSSDQFASLSDFIPLTANGNRVDAAIARRGIHSFIAETAPGGYGRRSPVTKAPYVGMPLQKFGRTTGLTTGTVTSVNEDLYINFGTPQSPNIVKFTHVIVASLPSDKGDSGSLVVTDDANKNPVGLLFAGNDVTGVTYLNPIDLVTSALGVTMDLQPTPDIQGPGSIYAYGTDRFTARDVSHRCTDGGPYSYEWSVRYGTSSTWTSVGSDKTLDLWTPPVGKLDLRLRMTDRNGSTTTTEKLVAVVNPSS